jgi:hypothetical protein
MGRGVRRMVERPWRKKRLFVGSTVVCRGNSQEVVVVAALAPRSFQFDAVVPRGILDSFDFKEAHNLSVRPSINISPPSSVYWQRHN